MELNNLIKQESALLARIEDQQGEIFEDQAKRLELLELTIKENVQTTISLLKKGSSLDYQIERAKGAIKELQEFIGQKESFRKEAEQVLYDLALKAPEGYLTVEGEIISYLKPSLSRHKHVDEFQIKENEGRYSLPALMAADYLKLCEILDFENTELAEKIKATAKHTAILSDLPEGHPAIQEEINKTVKFVKNKPKKE